MSATRGSAHGVVSGLVFAALIVASISTGIHAGAQAADRSVALRDTHRGINLVAVTPPPPGAYDIDLLGAAPAIANIKKAIDRIYAGSAFSAARIDILKKNGKVTLVYDAAFPKSKLASVIIAAFFPDFFQPEKGGEKEFLVVISRFGVKWPADKLAAVIVHELVGHGLQHLRGRTEKDRKIDKECEALIYEERAYQDFGVRRDTRDMKQFRHDVRNKWCADFRQFLTQAGLNADKVWNFGRPDVPALLTHFERYIAELRESGVAGRAVAASKARRESNLATLEARARDQADANARFLLGTRYLKGIGVDRDAKAGAKWIALAAQSGHARAQYVYGVLQTSGYGVGKNPLDAYMWLTLAADRGVSDARKARIKLEPALRPAQLAEARKRAREWQPAAAPKS